MNEDRTIEQIKINLSQIRRITGMKLRYRKFPRDWAPRQYGLERWYRKKEWSMSGHLYKTARELWVATEHWSCFAFEIETDQYAKERNAEDAKWEKLRKEGDAIEKQVNKVTARYADELRAWAND